MPVEIRHLSPERVQNNVAEVREEIAAACARAGRDPASVELLAAVKYVALEQLPVLREAGLGLVGENRAQELVRKAAVPGLFTWDFIGHLQSRQVKTVLPYVRLIHSVAARLRHPRARPPRPAGHRGARGGQHQRRGGQVRRGARRPGRRHRPLRAAGVTVAGLMTMPPLAERAEDSRRWFAALAELAGARDLPRLSMGTTQDFPVAVEEGATIVRIGTRLYR